MTSADVVAAFTGQRVVVLGDVMLDEYVHGDVSRISPEAPVPVLEIRERVFRAGGAANAAANVASLGGVPVLVGVVGEDGGATTVGTLLAAAGVETRALIATSDRPTTVKTRIVARGQQIVRLDHEAKASLASQAEDRVLAAVEREMERAGACIISDYAKGVVSERVAQAAIGAARRAGRPVIVDPKARSFAKYRGATVVTPNTRELELAAGRSPVHTDDEVIGAAAAVLPALEGAVLLVTRGALGMSLFMPGVPAVHLPTAAKAVYDVVGAGDTVVSTLALGLSVKASIELAVELANRAAGIVVSKQGTATVSPAELRVAMTG
jgi:D-beta-D-heptose 7-phosphate kinase/D-beta-D-heptose 1-phosphate adenosyltransferase